jgi:ArsR family metal-binding transcriptional regulator
MILKEISIIYTSPCIGDEGRMIAKAKLSADVEDMLPYINGCMRNVSSFSELKKLTFNRGMKIFCLEPEVAHITSS